MTNDLVSEDDESTSTLPYIIFNNHLPHGLLQGVSLSSQPNARAYDGSEQINIYAWFGLSRNRAGRNLNLLQITKWRLKIFKLILLP